VTDPADGDSGIAGPWAARARPGDEIALLGPGGGYAPNIAADWHLLVGDASALPAIAVALQRIPAERAAHVFIEVDSADEQQPPPIDADTHIHWVCRTSSEMVDSVRATRAGVRTSRTGSGTSRSKSAKPG